jgi:NitT/TauT family transport system permease protein
VVSQSRTEQARSSAAPKILLWTSVASIAGGLLIWELAGRFVVKKALFLTTPTQIVIEIVRLTKDGQLQEHVRVSAAEFVLGLLIAIVLGIAIGFAMATN